MQLIVWPRPLSKHPRCCVSTSFGLLFWPGLRRIVKSAGYKIGHPILSRSYDLAVWGRVPRSRAAIEKRPDAKVVTFEDAFLRSVLPGPKTPPVGITVDEIGVYFDSREPSELENILQSVDLNDETLLQRAKDGREFLRHYGVSKYNPVPPGSDVPLPSKYVLVVDQIVNDASIVGGNASAKSFSDMLAAAVAENPDKQIVVRTHPASKNGKPGHFTDLKSSGNVAVISNEINPWDLLDGASLVYCVSSQLGFEAILAGHRPIVFGIPFYAGWGLSEDRQEIQRRTRILTVDQLFAGVMIKYPIWFDRTRNMKCSFESAARQLHAESRHRWDGLKASNVIGMRMWKRRSVRNFLSGANRNVNFFDTQSNIVTKTGEHEQIVVWATKETENLAAECREESSSLLRMEDGFLRSTGLGAELVTASSLVIDDLGIYYDPSKPSRLEKLIEQAANLPDFAVKRASELHRSIVNARVTKYNLPATTDLPNTEGYKVILVPGQVEDDASILKGCDAVRTNDALLQHVRDANPDAYIIYKPHPDVVAGLRTGPINISKNYDYFADNHDVVALIDLCDELCTMTSLMGFEALLRGKKVTCYGTPFYAGWGLTRDMAAPIERRGIEVSMNGLIHAALIDYPRYMDPISGLPCTPELLVERLKNGQTTRKPVLRAVAKLQGWFSNYSNIWR